MFQNMFFSIVTWIFVPIFVLLLYYHRKFFFYSKELASIPSISIVKSFKAAIDGTPQDELFTELKKHIMPKGAYRRWNLNNWQVIITKYEYGKHFLSEPAEVLPKLAFPTNSPLGKVMGDGLVFSNGQKWVTHRRIANPSFNRALSPEVSGKTTIDLLNLLDKLVDQPIDVCKLMQRITVQILGQVAFSYDFKCLENLDSKHELLESYERIMKLTHNPIFYFFPWINSLPIKSSVEFKKELEDFDNKMLEIVQNKKDEIRKSKLSKNNVNDEDSTTSKDDLLYGMIEAAENEGYDLSSKHLRDEMVTFFLAGHDTTSHALSVAFYHLAKYPEIQKKAREEAISVLGVKGKIPTSEDLKNLKYINAIIKESLRLYPSLTITTSRITRKELKYGQMIIPKNTSVSVNIFAIHRDPENWSDPEKFIPERFLNKNDDNLHAWIPFSSGPRNCVGQNFSLMEQRVIISMLLLSYEISLPLKSPHNDKLMLNTGILVTPKNLELIFSKRT